ncbi:MAG: phenylacetate--CoA ligase [Planctomycetes bacterium]|nr:phenylacetate--CoA ligase [Planctomycetota bacterium]
MNSPFWNPKNENLPRADLERLQVAKLRRLLVDASERSAFHRRKLDEAAVTADSITSIDDLRRIPFTTRDEWMEAQDANPMFGDLLARPREDAIRYHLTSGTSGRNPLRVLDSRKDWQWISECWAYGFWAAGVRPTDTVFFAFSYGSFIGFWGAHYCCERIGSLVIPSGNMSTDMRVRQIAEMDVTTVCATPTYALRLAQAASEQGVDLAGSAVDKVIVSGEPAGSIPETKALIERHWGAKCFDTAGMTELGTICMFECSHQPGGMHVIDDHYIEEVINPDTGDPVGYGERGERVVTSFGRAMIPVLRYKTRDLVVKVPHDTCSCGRTFDIYEGGIQGRVDDMLLIRGTNVYPRAIESIVRSFDAVDEFQILVETIDNVDELTVRVEMKPGSSVTFGDICGELQEDLKEHHEMLRMNVAEAERGSLPRFELKAKRVVDNRRTKA